MSYSSDTDFLSGTRKLKPANKTAQRATSPPKLQIIRVQPKVQPKVPRSSVTRVTPRPSSQSQPSNGSGFWLLAGVGLLALIFGGRGAESSPRKSGKRKSSKERVKGMEGAKEFFVEAWGKYEHTGDVIPATTYVARNKAGALKLFKQDLRAEGRRPSDYTLHAQAAD